MAKEDIVRTNKQKALNAIKISMNALLVIALIALTVYLFPQIAKLKDDSVREQTRDFIKDRGAVGVLLMLGIQLLQIILSIIPGEPVEILFGFIYGPWIGALLCLGSITLGSFLVFIITRALGKKFMDKVETSGKFDKLKFLKDPGRRDLFIFILFFIPGTPKDTLTYFAPFTRIELSKFLILSTIARIPSVITSTFAGESIFSGDYMSTAIIFAVTGAAGIVGILIYNMIIKKHDANNGKEDKNDGTA